jgi:hypothetical protein
MKNILSLCRECCINALESRNQVKIMRKVMEFPTEWTIPDPIEDSDTSVEEQQPGVPDPQGAAPVKDEVRLVPKAGSAR